MLLKNSGFTTLILLGYSLCRLVDAREQILVTYIDHPEIVQNRLFRSVRYSQNVMRIYRSVAIVPQNLCPLKPFVECGYEKSP